MAEKEEKIIGVMKIDQNGSVYEQPEFSRNLNDSTQMTQSVFFSSRSKSVSNRHRQKNLKSKYETDTTYFDTEMNGADIANFKSK